MSEKYKIRTDLRHPKHTGLYRIEALRDFGDVKKGDLGGYVSSEENLSHEGLCWVYRDARVYGNAEVSGNAQVYGDARVFGNAHVSGDAWVYRNACVYGNARIYGIAEVKGNSDISDDIKLYENKVYENVTLPEIPRIIRETELYRILEQGT